jgi:hypothetical protein
MNLLRRKICIRSLSPFWIHVCTELKNKYEFIIIFILAASLGLIFEYLGQSPIRLFLLSIVLISASIILIITYIVKLFETGKEFGLIRYVPGDIVVYNRLHKVTFDTDAFDGKKYLKHNHTEKIYKCAKTEICYTLQNKMDRPYNRFLITLNSSTFVPSNSNITCIVNEHAINLDKQPSDHDVIHSYNFLETGGEIHRGVQKQLLIPILTQSKQFTNILIKYPTQAYDNALNSEEDFVESLTLHLTERLDIEIHLEGKFRDHFRLIESTNTDPIDGGNKTFEVMDHSAQRMLQREDDLKKDKMIPIFNDSKICWTIYHPKITYRYRLYFMIEKKEMQNANNDNLDNIPLARPVYINFPESELLGENI